MCLEFPYLWSIIEFFGMLNSDFTLIWRKDLMNHFRDTLKEIGIFRRNAWITLIRTPFNSADFLDYQRSESSDSHYLLQQGMLTTFLQRSFSLEFSEIRCQHHIMLSLTGCVWNLEIMNCGIFINMPCCISCQPWANGFIPSRPLQQVYKSFATILYSELIHMPFSQRHAYILLRFL